MLIGVEADRGFGGRIGKKQMTSIDKAK